MKRHGGSIVLAVIVIAAALAGLSLGEAHVPFATLWSGAVTGEGPGALILNSFRGPRVVTALGAGAVLGMAGMLFQTLFRNPLASPDLLGFNAGAELAIIAGVIAGLALPMPLVAAVGGLAAAALTAFFAARPGHETPPLTTILVGLGIGFLCSALSVFAMTLMPTNQAGEAQRWLIGSLAARIWDHAAQVWGIGAVLAVLALAQLRRLGAIELGADMAAGLGLHVGAARRWIAATAVLLAATGVAVAGPVPFVALMALPVAVSLTQARGLAGRLIAAAAAGAAILTFADVAARAAVPGIQLPAGVMTGLLGAPYLLARLSREMKKGTL
ncbi:iron ABC transporter permease [Sinirhodobacter populi]|uniref:Iron ABC transporter permease n=1 Tax=Paenirhodobacter populi TaxID=2306993 RepID=A0A443K4F8_9RHOB|nr:iron ABC transporter permease [Sinirhodobacter populi]RWR05397.1 iron ABC transporter permease [Sinirhodobacter populi]RWR27644.1 iron ABC transporter permease [Sinirhodobacter populi]